MFLDPSEFRRTIAAALKVDPATLAGYWDAECQRCQESAYKDVRGALLARGFTAAQVDQWDRGAEFERDIGLYWACVRGIGAVAVDPAVLDRLDRRAELATVPVEVPGGAPQQPAATPGRISAGMLRETDANGVPDRWTRHTRL